MSENRMDSIFKCIVEQYVDTAQPVGSRAVSKIYEGHLSPASVRNVMADLEENGLISQPHTSAGRIPTEKGYRYYVDHLMATEDDEIQDIPDVMRLLQGIRDVEEAAEKVSRILADLTNNASVMLMKNVRRLSYFDRHVLKHEHAEPGASHKNDRIYVEGTSHMLEQPEFQDVHRLASLIRAFEGKENLASFLGRGLQDRKLHIHIGHEVDCPDLVNVSVIVKEYSLDDEPLGCLGVIGPMRMKYDRTIGIVDRMADVLTDYFEGLR